VLLVVIAWKEGYNQFTEVKNKDSRAKQGPFFRAEMGVLRHAIYLLAGLSIPRTLFLG
jgi:hypothetical protein